MCIKEDAQALDGLIEFWIARDILLAEVICDLVVVFHGSRLTAPSLHRHEPSVKQRKEFASPERILGQLVSMVMWRRLAGRFLVLVL